MDKKSLVTCLAAIMVVTLTLPTVMASDSNLLAERLQRHHEPPVKPEHAQPPPQQGRQQSVPGHAGERRPPDHAGQGERPEHSRQDRSRETRGERPQHAGSREQTPATGGDSRWITHGAPETDTDEDADEASDDDRIYFQRYP